MAEAARDLKYCIICFNLPDSRAWEIPSSLRRLLGRPEFKTKAKRMGKVVRVADVGVSFYSVNQWNVKSLN